MTLKKSADYQLIKPLGSGAFGTCDLYCHKDKLKTLVVIKKVPIKESEEESQKQMNEVELLKNCQHPFVIGFYEYFIEDGFINIVMQYAAGGSLASFLEKKKKTNEYLNDEAIIFYFTQMTMALDYLHKLNVVHCDLKPDNILMNTSQRILKLADFGISRVASGAKFVESASKAGTCHYIAPEIYIRSAYDKPMDIWALGCVLYELMEFEIAFSGPQSIAELKIINASWTPPKIKRNPELMEILSKCLVPTVDSRAKTAELLFMPPVLKTIAKLCTITDVRPGEGDDFDFLQHSNSC